MYDEKILNAGKSVNNVIKVRQKELGLDLKTFASLCASYSDIKQSTMSSYICNAKGYLCYLHLLPHAGVEEKYNVKRARKLGTVLDVLGISQDSDVVSSVRKVYPSFEYPPKKEKVENLEDNVKKLKPKDKEWLERTAHRIVSQYN